MGVSQNKVAVVGTGVASLGILTALLDKKSDLEIIVYDLDRKIAQASLDDNPSKERIVSFYDQVYKKIRSTSPLKFPPPKTHFGEQIARQSVGKNLSIFKSESFGGLTNYWGATMLPFTDQEMKEWPISRQELDPYYQKMAQVVGLAARLDDLNKYFPKDYSTRPPLKTTAELSRLNQVVNNQKDDKPARNASAGGEFKIISGLNRCGLETRLDRFNHCVYCGECMAGCFKDAIYSSRMTIKKYLQDPQVKYVQAKVKKINQKGNFSEIETDQGLETGFSRIFLGAGCLHSTEIIIRSLKLKQKLFMADNAVYAFPIFYFGKKLSQDDSYLSLCNLIFGCIPQKENEHFAQVQVYPNFDYLWRYNLSPKLWPVFKKLSSFLRPHLFFGRLYLHSDHSQSYSVELKDDQLVLDKAKEAESGQRIKTLMSNLHRVVNHQGFYIPPISPIRQRVNTHYTSTLSFNNNAVKVSSLGEVMPYVYLCDSSVFPDSPAINPGFTIMANAYRIVDQVI